MRPITIYNSSKIAFLIIFISTAITILLIIYLKLFIPSSNNSIENKVDDLEELNSDAENEDSDEISENTENNEDLSEETNDLVEESVETTIEPENIEFNSTESKTDNTVLSENNIQNSFENNNYDNSLPEDFSKPVSLDKNNLNNSKKVSEIEETKFDYDKTETDENHQTPKTEIENDENILESRLDKELTRAISSETDVSLLLIRIPDLNKKETIAQNIKNLLIDEFQYSDLVFDFSQDCFAAIKLNCNLEEAINLSDNLNHKINDILGDEHKICFIGLASRTLRIVSAKRIILEAKEALVHAQQDPTSPIVAFRVDSEKYMKLMENK